MTYEEIIYETAIIASAIARLMIEIDISDDEEVYLNRALDDLKIFASVHRNNNKVFKEDYKYGKQENI